MTLQSLDGALSTAATEKPPFKFFIERIYPVDFVDFTAQISESHKVQEGREPLDEIIILVR